MRKKTRFNAKPDLQGTLLLKGESRSGISLQITTTKEVATLLGCSS